MIFGKLRPYLAKSYLVNEAASCTGEFLVMRPKKGFTSRYVYYLSLSRPWLEWADATSYGSKMPRTSWESLAGIGVLAPSLEVQESIGDFLDRETAKIDALIAKQEQLIATLREDRTATINNAVSAPDTIVLRRLVDPQRPMTYGILQCGEPVVDGVPYIGPSDMQGEGQSPPLESLRRTTAAIASVYRRSVLAEGDIVVSIGPAYGKVAIVDADLAGANLTQDTVRVAALPNLADSRFLVWVLISYATGQFWDSQITGATFRRLNLGTLARTPIPIISLREQRRIVAYLETQIAKIDKLIGKADQLIDTLREYRAALITDAVTGKIDVRGVA